MIEMEKIYQEGGEKMRENKNPAIPGTRKVILHPRLCTCRECGGIGYIFTYDEVKDETCRRTCTNCNGSGRVKVRVTIFTEVQPFNPGKDDKADVVRM